MPQFVSPPNVHPSAAVTLMKSSKKQPRTRRTTHNKSFTNRSPRQKKLAHQVRNELNETRTTRKWPHSSPPRDPSSFDTRRVGRRQSCHPSQEEITVQYRLVQKRSKFMMECVATGRGRPPLRDQYFMRVWHAALESPFRCAAGCRRAMRTDERGESRV